eukprot:scaffold74372_cov57-Attheya_sp.AAC.2
MRIVGKPTENPDCGDGRDVTTVWKANMLDIFGIFFESTVLELIGSKIVPWLDSFWGPYLDGIVPPMDFTLFPQCRTVIEDCLLEREPYEVSSITVRMKNAAFSITQNASQMKNVLRFLMDKLLDNLPSIVLTIFPESYYLIHSGYEAIIHLPNYAQHWPNTNKINYTQRISELSSRHCTQDSSTKNKTKESTMTQRKTRRYPKPKKTTHTRKHITEQPHEEKEATSMRQSSLTPFTITYSQTANQNPV